MITKILDTVFSSRSNIVILRALKSYSVGVSGREVARLTGLTPKSCLKTLTLFENTGIITRIRGGRDHIFNLNRKHFLVEKAILPLLDAELNFFDSLKKEIKSKLQKKCSSVYVFGSVARREDTLKSDLDICVILNNEIREELLEIAISDLRKNIFTEYGVSISPFYITQKEFIKRARSKKPPLPDILENGIYIFGNQINKLING